MISVHWGSLGELVKSCIRSGCELSSLIRRSNKKPQACEALLSQGLAFRVRDWQCGRSRTSGLPQLLPERRCQTTLKGASFLPLAGKAAVFGASLSSSPRGSCPFIAPWRLSPQGLGGPGRPAGCTEGVSQLQWRSIAQGGGKLRLLFKEGIPVGLSVGRGFSRNHLCERRPAGSCFPLRRDVRA